MSPQSGCSYAEVADGYGPTKARFRVKYLPGWTANSAAKRLYRGKFAVMSHRHFAIRATTQLYPALRLRLGAGLDYFAPPALGFCDSCSTAEQLNRVSQQ